MQGRSTFAQESHTPSISNWLCRTISRLRTARTHPIVVRARRWGSSSRATHIQPDSLLLRRDGKVKDGFKTLPPRPRRRVTTVVEVVVSAARFGRLAGYGLRMNSPFS